MDVAPVSQAGKELLVGATLENVVAYNKVAYMAQHTDWAGYESQFGAAMTEKAKAHDIAGLNTFANLILFESSMAGVPVTAPTTGASDGSTSTPALTVADAPFKAGAATINVKTEADRSLTAFKDGQVWKSFTAISLLKDNLDSRAGDIALQLLITKQGKSTLFA